MDDPLLIFLVILLNTPKKTAHNNDVNIPIDNFILLGWSIINEPMKVMINENNFIMLNFSLKNKIAKRVVIIGSRDKIDLTWFIGIFDKE